MLYRDVYRFYHKGEFTLEAASYDGMNRAEVAVKRLSDVVLSFLGLIVLSPLMLCIAIILKLQGGGSVIYKQERIGLHGKPFTIYKFRTCREGAEAMGPMLSMPDDDRVTPTGRVLRDRHLDELPQLWNVLKGDMSLVGPRPERKFFIDKIMKYDSRYERLYVLRPGVTSDATLHNGYTDTMEKMLKRLDRDLYYLENRSLLMDVKIIAETAWSFISCKKF